MVKVSETSYPALEKMVDTISTKIGIKTPQLFIYNDPYMNAFTYGVENPFVAISSSMLEIMNGWTAYELRNLDDDTERARVCGVSVSEVRKDVKAIVTADSDGQHSVEDIKKVAEST